VSQAASVLDAEMAKGVLAAHSAAGASPRGFSNAGNPVLRQIHEFVDNLAALWPSLHGGAVKVSTAEQPTRSNPDLLTQLKAPAAVKPGERATVSMALRNSESQAVHLVPTATDLLGSRGGRIAFPLLEFTPSALALEPNEQKDMSISITVPLDTSPGCYSGLLVVTGLEYLRAVIIIDVV
jgi:hypothetical protein